MFDKRAGGLSAHAFKAFTPFSDGPKRCPAAQLALKEMRAVLAMVLHEFELVGATGASSGKGGTRGVHLVPRARGDPPSSAT